MKLRSLKRRYLKLSIFVVLMFYLIPYMLLKNPLGLELLFFWVGVTFTWLVVTNALLIGDFI
ncbi:MAG: hypothetical protein QXP80_00835 [Zestosphaera sp.]